jgi:hypothetical protein
MTKKGFHSPTIFYTVAFWAIFHCSITQSQQEDPNTVVREFTQHQRASKTGLRKDDRPEWIARFENAIANGPDQRHTDTALLRLAELYREIGENEKALATLDKVADLENATEINRLNSALRAYNYAERVGDGESSIAYIDAYRELINKYLINGERVPDRFLRYYDFYHRERSQLQNKIGRKKHARLTKEGRLEDAELAKATHFWKAVTDMEKYVDYVSKTPAMAEQYSALELGGNEAFRTMVKLLNEVAEGYSSIDRSELVADVDDRTIQILERYLEQHEIGHDPELIGELLNKHFKKDPVLERGFVDKAKAVMEKVDRAGGIYAVVELYKIADRLYEDDASTASAIELLRYSMTYTEEWYPGNPTDMSYYQNSYLTLAFHYMNLEQPDEAKAALDTFASMETKKTLKPRYDDLLARYESSQKPRGEEDGVSSLGVAVAIAGVVLVAGLIFFLKKTKN